MSHKIRSTKTIRGPSFSSKIDLTGAELPHCPTHNTNTQQHTNTLTTNAMSSAGAGSVDFSKVEGKYNTDEMLAGTNVQKVQQKMAADPEGVARFDEPAEFSKDQGINSTAENKLKKDDMKNYLGSQGY
ncbi:hypothetical protein PROFUN_11099 [Planoprotostelium fungivorum]|uniref:Uncharacterized protein n=1 Tax=Planoprotostelium fungivorum TaxID=1890364 RepID=A0A2P6NAK2_9EUKA|nr:hypothetical protein PROFUN_11099 [Planoprotostelium fungivorum]